MFVDRLLGVSDFFFSLYRNNTGDFYFDLVVHNNESCDFDGDMEFKSFVETL